MTGALRGFLAEAGEPVDAFSGTIIVGVRTDESISEESGRLVELFEEEVAAMLADEP